MHKGLLNKAGLAAVILLAPGGFVLGATLLARRYRRKREGVERGNAAAVGNAEDVLPEA